jgi:hypothetical protein
MTHAYIVRVFGMSAIFFSVTGSINVVSAAMEEAAAHDHRVSRAVSLTPQNFDPAVPFPGPPPRSVFALRFTMYRQRNVVHDESRLCVSYRFRENSNQVTLENTIW